MVPKVNLINKCHCDHESKFNKQMHKHSPPRKKCKRYNTLGHAHELTFSTYRQKGYFEDTFLCDLFLEELDKTRNELHYSLWAYVVMPTHIHLLVWPQQQDTYHISQFLNHVKGRTAGRYREHLQQNAPEKYARFLVLFRGAKSFRLWQRGGGFDRNMVHSKAIYNAIRYIEANPVQAKLVSAPEEWKWSSAYARKKGMGVLPDVLQLPIEMMNPQKQRIGIV